MALGVRSRGSDSKPSLEDSTDKICCSMDTMYTSLQIFHCAIAADQIVPVSHDRVEPGSPILYDVFSGSSPPQIAIEQESCSTHC